MSKLRKWMMKEERDTTSCGSGDLSSSAIKLFGKTIAVSGGADSASVSASVSTKAGSEEVDGASTQLEGENLGSSPGSVCNETESKDADVVNEDYVVATPEVAPEVVTATLVVESSSPLPRPVSEESNPTTQQPEKVPQRALTQEEKKEQCLKKPDKLIPCPRCESVDTKFCYYNNYNINQPRHFCKSCQRYWTAGGTLRNVLVGAGRRKNKYGVAQSRQDGSGAENLTAVRMDHHESAQQSFPSPAVMNSYTLGTVPPMNLPRHGVTHSPHNNNNNNNNNVVVSDSQPGSTITTNTMHGLGSAFKPLGPEISSDSVSKLRQRTQTTTTTTTAASDVKADCATSGETTPNTYVLTPRATPDASQAVWTKSNAAPLGFFNGAWPYGYNIGWSGAGPIPGAGSATPSPVWTGMWASAAAPVPTFGWNMLQGSWTLPWRPVPAVGVQMQVATATTPTSRKREGSDADVVPSKAKIARVGAPGEEVVAV